MGPRRLSQAPHEAPELSHEAPGQVPDQVPHGAPGQVPHRQRVGARGERLAAAWYRAAGYDIVARNWRCREGEIDLVVHRPGELVFCEVKTRTSGRFGTPAEAVTAAKQRRLRVLAAQFLAEAEAGPHARRGDAIRFDVAAVAGGRIEVIEGAF